MQIQVKEAELVTALKNHVSNQGIALSGKHVIVAFVAGRKGAGISATVTIEDEAIPGFETADPVVATKPKLKSVPKEAGDTAVIETVPVAAEATQDKPSLFN